MNVNFVKLSALSSKDRTKIKNYWTPLWGSEFSQALTTDYMTSGNKKKGETFSNSETEKKNKK
jgi:hypothetical protein